MTDGFAGLIGSVKLNCSFDELQQAIRELRSEAVLPRPSTLSFLDPASGS